MDEKQQQMKSMVKQTVGVGNDFVEPGDQLNEDEMSEWMIDKFVNANAATEWNGYHFVPGFDAETAKYAFENFNPKRGDVLVATFAKTGTNWVMEIVRNIVFLKDKDLLMKTKQLPMFYQFLEFGPAKKFKIMDNMKLPRRILATHVPAPLTNLEKFRKTGSKILYVIRNPKDQAVSWYNFVMRAPFTKNEPLCKLYPQNERDFYNIFLTGKQRVFAKDGEGYLEHVKEWYKHKGEEHIMFLFFEEMKQDIHREIRKIADFIDVALTDDEIEQIAQNTSFQRMKTESTDASGKPTFSTTLFRKGQVGDWKNHLTVAESELIDANVDKVLGDTDIKFIYE